MKRGGVNFSVCCVADVERVWQEELTARWLGLDASTKKHVKGVLLQTLGSEVSPVMTNENDRSCVELSTLGAAQSRVEKDDAPFQSSSEVCVPAAAGILSY